MQRAVKGLCLVGILCSGLISFAEAEVRAACEPARVQLDALAAIQDNLGQHPSTGLHLHLLGDECGGYAAFPDGALYLFRVANPGHVVGFCSTDVIPAVKDGADPRADLTEGRMRMLSFHLDELDWTNPDCRVSFIRRGAGTVAVSKSGQSGATIWFKGDHSPARIPVTLTAKYLEPAVADRVAQILFEGPVIRSIDYLGDRGLILAADSSGGHYFYLLASPDSDPHRICFEDGLKKYQEIEPSLRSEMESYAANPDQLSRQLVTLERKPRDPAVFAFACP